MRYLFILFASMPFVTTFLLAAQSPPTGVKNAASGSEAVKYLFAAAKADDAEGFAAQLGDRSRSGFELGKAFDAYEIAMTDRFGKNRLNNPPMIKNRLEVYSTRTYFVRDEVIKDKHKSILTVWVTTALPMGQNNISEETWTGSKKGNGWKIDFPEKGEESKPKKVLLDGKEITIRVLNSKEPDTKKSLMMQKMNKDTIELLGRFAKEVREGRYKTREETEDALNKAKISLQRD